MLRIDGIILLGELEQRWIPGRAPLHEVKGVKRRLEMTKQENSVADHKP